MKTVQSFRSLILAFFVLSVAATVLISPVHASGVTNLSIALISDQTQLTTTAWDGEDHLYLTIVYAQSSDLAVLIPNGDTMLIDNPSAKIITIKNTSDRKVHVLIDDSQLIDGQPFVTLTQYQYVTLLLYHTGVGPSGPTDQKWTIVNASYKSQICFDGFEMSSGN